MAHPEGLCAAMERLSHAARSEFRPRRVSQALQREAPSSLLRPRPAARHHIAPLVCVFLPLAGPALLMRAACVLGSARSTPKPEPRCQNLASLRVSWLFTVNDLSCDVFGFALARYSQADAKTQKTFLCCFRV